MKSIMIIAGDKTEKLADFFTERGAFSVDYAYNSLSTNVVQIRDAIINVDKLLYVYQDGINIKADMQVLKESLSNGAFFTVKEMVFVTSDDEEAVVAKKYFSAVIESTGFSNYEIKTIAGRLTFAGIYDTVLGISVDANVKNTFKTVYRVERGDKAKKAFVPADDSNLLIEPFDDSNQLELEKRKTNIINTESGIPRKDQSSGTNIETYFNPVLNPMSLDNSVFSKNTIIVSGDRKSGVSVWSAALAVSASKLDKPVMLFDFTDNSDISELLSDNFIEFKSYRMQELLHSFSLYNRINVCAAFNADGVPCYGYSFCLSRSGKCDPDKANRNGVPPEIWTDLQHNKVIRMNGRVFTKDLIMGEARKGLKVTYTTDTRPCDNIVKFAKDSDLFICEGMYGSDDNLDNAVKNYHMTFSEAASLARDAHVEQMWLTHYSPGLVDPEKYISNATNIFKRTMCAYDTLSTVLEYQ